MAKNDKQDVLVDEPVQVKKQTEVKKPQAPKWEIKDRQYYVKGLGSPLTYVLQSKSTRKKPLLWFDEEKGVNREMRYASNQNSIFMDEQDSNAILEHIIFEDGVLYVPKQINLYKNYYHYIILEKVMYMKKKMRLLKLKIN